MARATFINNDGAGFANSVEVRDGETIEQFLNRNGITDPNKYHIRVNGAPVAGLEQVRNGDKISALPKPGEVAISSQVTDGCRVTATPKNVGGATL